MWTEKKHSSCHRAKFHEIELFPFISRFFKKKTLQIQKGIQVQFHDFLMIFFQYNFRLYFYPKTLKLILLPKQKKIFETKSTFQRWSNWSLLWWDAFFIILSIVWLRITLFYVKKMHKLLTYYLFIIFWFYLTLYCIPFKWWQFSPLIILESK